MKKGLKQLLSFAVVMLMILSLMPPSALAEDGTVITDTAPSEDRSAGTAGNQDPSEEYKGKVIILHTNDVHGAIDRYAYVAGLKADFLARGAEAVLLVDAGDFSQGTIYVSDNLGKNGVLMMNAVGYDFAALGNHEFDYGIDPLWENLSLAQFGILCCNMRMENGSPLAANVEPNHIWTSSGISIGLFGLGTPETRTKANPAKIRGLVVDGEEDIVNDVKVQTEYLKENGADLIICVSHLGVNESSYPYRSTDIYEKFADDIDFVIDGHSHTVMEEGPAHEPIQSTGTALEDIGVIVIDVASKSIDDSYLYVIDENSPKDEDVEALAKEMMEKTDTSFSAVFASTEVFLEGRREYCRTQETNLGDLVADAMLWSVISEGNLELPEGNYLAVTNGGGIRANLPGTSAPDSIVSEISKKDVNTVLPFGNTVAVVYVTGAQLLEALEASTYCSPKEIGGFPQVSGIEYVIDINKEYDANDEHYPGSTYFGPKSIKRVTITSVNGKPFDPAATYAVVTNDFCAGGGDTYYAFASASRQFDTGIKVDEALMTYIGTALNGVVDDRYASPAGRVRYTQPESQEPTYEFIEGAGQTLKRGSSGEASFRIDAPVTLFVRLLLDGETVDQSLYSVYEGSTVVVLSKQLVDSLSTGGHTLTAVFADGKTTEAPFYVADTSSDASPYTGVYTHMAEWILCLVLAFATAMVTALRRRQMN